MQYFSKEAHRRKTNKTGGKGDSYYCLCNMKLQLAVGLAQFKDLKQGKKTDLTGQLKIQV